MGKLSRRKGKVWELEVVRLLEEATGVDCERNLRDAFGRGNSGDVCSPLPFCVQAKVGKQPNPWTAVREAEEAAQPGEYAVGIVRKNATHSSKQPTDLAILPLADFLALLELLKANGAL